MKKRIISILVLILTFSLLRISVFAEPKQAELITTDTKEDLTVMFTFDKSIVDIVFISPSGARKTKADADVEYASGDLWCTYRIKNADAGTWQVEYDLGSNSKIDYSVMEENSGLWIQVFNIKKASDTELEFDFRADYDGDISYNYELFAISSADTEMTSLISQGIANANIDEALVVDMSNMASDSYYFRLDVYYDNGSVEVFDSATSEAFEFVNPNAPVTIENYKVQVEQDDLMVSVDWEDFAVRDCEAYKLVGIADGVKIFSEELGLDTLYSGFSFPEGTASLEIKLAYKSFGIWSGYKTKTINFAEEYLTNKTGRISGSYQIVLGYKFKQERDLHVLINGKEGNFRVKDEGEAAFDVQSGVNTIYAEAESDDLIFYVIDTEVFLDANAPVITLYDDLDGKTVFADHITILGKVTGAKVFKIAGNEIELGEDGTFSYDAKLADGENVINIEAEDANGNASLRTVTIYKGAIVSDKTTGGWTDYIALFAAILVSIVIIILAIVFIKKSSGKEGKGKLRPIFFIIPAVIVAALDGIFIWQYSSRHAVVNSLSFLEMVEKSMSRAVEYVKIERLFGSLVITASIVLLILIGLTVLAVIMNKKKPDEDK